MALASGLKGMDTSNVDVDDEQTPPMVACGSAEERELLQKLETQMAATEALLAKWEAFEASSKIYKEIPLWCLRGRKYDVDRALELLPRLIDMIEELELEKEDAAGDRLLADLETHKLVATGTKDPGGRGVVWARLRFHDPKVSKAKDMGRLMASVMLHVLRHDPEVQRLGVSIVQDMNGLGLGNLDPLAAKYLLGHVLSNLPIRVGRICIVHPPWIVGKIILPIAMTLMSAKLRSRIAIINGSKPDPLFQHVPRSALPLELGGEAQIDIPAFVAAVAGKV